MTAARIETTSDGLGVLHTTGTIAVTWADVSIVQAYAIDAITQVIRYLELTLTNGHAVELTSSMDGWESILQALPGPLELEVDDVPAVVDALEPNGPVLVIARGTR